MNPEGDNSSADLVYKILQFQQSNVDKAVPGTSFSSHFIDVQLKSLLSVEDFSPDLFSCLMDMTIDSNVCRHIWSNYQTLITQVIANLSAFDPPKDDELPGFTPDFLRIVARLLRAQIDLNKKEDKLEETKQLITSIDDSIPLDNSAFSSQQLEDNELFDDLQEDIRSDDEFKSTFQEVDIFNFQKLFKLVSKLFEFSSSPPTLAGCLKILVELSTGAFIQVEQIFSLIGIDTFMSKLHFVMICSTNPILQQAIGEFLRFFSTSFPEEFCIILPLIQNAVQVREAKFSSSLMENLVESILYIDPWPLDTEFYEFLNLLAVKLKEFDDLEEAKQRFYARLESHNQSVCEHNMKSR